MVNPNVADRLKAIPYRLRCAVLLGQSERLLPELGAEAQGFARHGLQAAWDWLGGKQVAARAIHDKLTLLEESLRTKTPEREEKAIWAIGFALAYVSWRAFGLEVGDTSDPAKLAQIPGDMFDVTDEYVDQVLNYASTVDSGALEWVLRTLETLGTFPPDAGESLGEAVSRKDLGL